MSILSNKEIGKNCFLSTSYNKAQKLCEGEDINSISIRKSGKDSVIIKSNVKGNTKKSYNISIEFKYTETKSGNKKAKVETCSCECEAYRTYKGFCKHIAATVLEANKMFSDEQIKDILDNCAIGYQISHHRDEMYGRGINKTGRNGDIQNSVNSDNVNSNSGNSNNVNSNINDNSNNRNNAFHVAASYNQSDANSDRRGFMYDALSNILELENSSENNNWLLYSDESGNGMINGRSNAPKSSKKLLEVMSGVVLKERNKFCQETSHGNVRLEAILNIDNYGTMGVEFKIGSGQMYVIKSIPNFIENIKNQDMVRYGKNLQFSHNQSAFTKDSLPLISLLLDSEMKKSPYSYSNSIERRFLQLTPKNTDILMEHFEGRAIKTGGQIAEEYPELKVKRENPKLNIYIDGIDAGRHAVITFSDILLLEGVKSLYVISKGCIYICSEEYCNDMGEVLKLMNTPKWRSGGYYYRNTEASGKLELAKRDYAYFCSTLLPIFEKYTKLEINGVSFEQYTAVEGKYELYFELKNGRDIICMAKAIYGDRENNLITIATVQENYRDIKTEYELRSILMNYLPDRTKDGKYFLLKDDDERLAALIEFGIDELKSIADVFVSDDFKKIKLADNVRFTTGLSIKGNLLSVSWNIEGMSNDELYEILGSYSKKKKYYRLRSGELLNLYESGIDVLADINDNLRLTKSQIIDGTADVPVYRSLYMDMLVEENKEKIEAVKSEQFNKFINNFENLRGKQYELPKEVSADLREYQFQGYRWACSLAEFGFGGILADDMGLGKTLQMISYLCSASGKTHIVICPASLVYNWEAEFNKFAENMSVCIVVGNAAQRMELISKYRDYDVLVTSYDLLKRDIEYYSDKAFGCEIIDEAQYIKNPSTQAAKAVRAIKSDNRFALTGTPIENRLSELWSIFEYLMPGYLYSYQYFKETFETKIMTSADTISEQRDTPLSMLHKMIRPFILRRLKKDVLKELPDKVEKIVYTKFGDEQEKLYKATEKNIVMNIGRKSGKEFMESKLQILAEITKLRQICCAPALLYGDYKGESAKLETCIELIESAIDGGHRILLFSQFATMLGIISDRLKKCGIRTFMLTGSTSKVSRKNMVENFQNGGADVFLISLKAGGTGLNLTSADMVIHYDPWWNVAAQNQATDRAHRIGQENKVTVIKLIAKNTIEERIVKLQDMKKELADKVISGENVSMSSLTKEELLELFHS